MKTLIINADDFGLTEGVCAGIVECIESGVLTTTSAMMCVSGSRRIARWGRRIEGRIGLHLQLSNGRPLLGPARVPSLVREDGSFPASRREPMKRRTGEIIMEWHAQMAALLDTGIEPTHIDTHHHIHLQPDVLDAYIEFSACYRLPARAVESQCADALASKGAPVVHRTLIDFYGGELSAVRVLDVLLQGTSDLQQSCVVELMTHPGRVDRALAPLTKYVHERECEIVALCTPGLRRAIADAGFKLSTFGAFHSPASPNVLPSCGY